MNEYVCKQWVFRKISIDIHISDNISADGFMKLTYDLLLIESQ